MDAAAVTVPLDLSTADEAATLTRDAAVDGSDGYCGGDGQ